MTKRPGDSEKTQLLLGNDEELNLTVDDLWYGQRFYLCWQLGCEQPCPTALRLIFPEIFNVITHLTVTI